MLISYTDLRQFSIEAKDGRKGRAEDLYFDDETWQIRYVVTESGFLFTRQEGLVKSTLMGAPNVEARVLPISLTKEQIEDAESPDAHPPVSEQRERHKETWRTDVWPPIMLGVPGTAYTPTVAEQQLLTPGANPERDDDKPTKDIEDPQLRSLAEVLDYAIKATDDEIGGISDFVIDPDGWKIVYIVIDTGKWLPGRQVAIKPDWISGVSWAEQTITVRVSTKEVSEAPELSEIDELERSDAHLALAPYGAYGGFYV